MQDIGNALSEALENVKAFFSRLFAFIREKCAEVLSSPPEICENDVRTLCASDSERINTAIQRILGRHFTKGRIGEELKELSATDRTQRLQAFANDLWVQMGIEGVELEISFELGQESCPGAYRHNTRSVILNGHYVVCDDPAMLREVVGTILHETRYAMQLHALLEENRFGFTDAALRLWAQNYLNPIEPDQDLEGYVQQDSEMDARYFSRASLHFFENTES